MVSPRAPVWPNLFIPGAAKSGTTSLTEFLRKDPDIFAPVIKEPHSLASRPQPDRLRPLVEVVTGEDRYLKLFRRGAAHRYRLDASTSYLQDPVVPRKIATLSPSGRVIILLRDPVERAYSHYRADWSQGIDARSYADAVEADAALPIGEVGEYSAYVRDGLYAEALTRYMAALGDRVHVVFFEELVSAPTVALGALCDFLTLEESMLRGPFPLWNQGLVPRDNIAWRLFANSRIRLAARRLSPRPLRSVGRRLALKAGPFGPPDREITNFLRQYFAADMGATKELLGKSLPWGRDDRN